MHPRTIDGETAFATQSIIDGQQNRSGGTKHANDEDREKHAQVVEIPGGIAKETMESPPMSIADIAARENDVGDVSMSMRENPTGADLREGAEGWLGEDGNEMS